MIRKCPRPHLEEIKLYRQSSIAVIHCILDQGSYNRRAGAMSFFRSCSSMDLFFNEFLSSCGRPFVRTCTRLHNLMCKDVICIGTFHSLVNFRTPGCAWCLSNVQTVEVVSRSYLQASQGMANWTGHLSMMSGARAATGMKCNRDQQMLEAMHMHAFSVVDPTVYRRFLLRTIITTR